MILTDGISTDIDCDDSSADVINTNENDSDCDGISTDIDCDDSSADVTNTNENDSDCDGISTDIDCDDSSAITKQYENDLIVTVTTDIDCDDEIHRYNIQIMMMIVMASLQKRIVMTQTQHWTEIGLIL